ncbi:MAG: chorismate synthase [Chloroflexi bacterium]|nr:chorismate synthase [Chloroflexota bacterium]MCI0818340.1 chorismate synthase [Chloroflexota bacterium]MCI0832263.1 chorismate synthase [Chloroflexota bacterium]MCI0838328.1 chorismate synthase [Chloroflexota bacterium]MCI0843446.1 chorismate synthase [Chloroflexota bacterium]
MRFLTAGESHGQALVAIVEGIPAGLPLTEEYIAAEMKRRQGGYGRSKRQQLEQDHAQLIGGVRHGRTLGSPVAMVIANRVWEDWQEVMQVGPYEGDPKRVTRLRPGHADLAGAMKYGFDDVRNVLERASARETAARVAVGSVCRRFLEEFGVAVRSHTASIGNVVADVDGEPDWDAVEASPVRCADAKASERMVAAIDEAREAGDTLGGTFEMWATGVPIGLGSHVQWDRKLDGQVAQAVMSIHATKGVDIGGGFAVAAGLGSQAHDVIMPPDKWDGRQWRRETNRAGGLEGGMTNGEPVVVRGALKPISTLSKPLPSVDLISGEVIQAHYERSDVCTVPAAGVVGEAMIAIVIARAMLEKFGGDSLDETRRAYAAYQDTIGPRGQTG